MLLLVGLSLTFGLTADDSLHEDWYVPQLGDDEVVEVTVGELRIANYYYEMFFVEQNAKMGFQTLYNEAIKELQDCNKEYTTGISTIKSLRKAIGATIGVAAGIVIATVTVTCIFLTGRQ